ncbi:SGNH/GDSL hydrolase family protein [Liquorilactobacillus sicerae]|uniref:SGNH/GDSL hydrolase family protein n=1 Tax=Liquorilactobacillus sicerae TaxID=1416943 RepID=UPI00248110C3|nr:SGNH/GDSL hydrolase family protein [Liquorilactobacillus sicerae]
MKNIKSILKSCLALVLATLLVFGIWQLFFYLSQSKSITPKTSNSQVANKSSTVKKVSVRHLKLVGLGDSLTQGVGDTTDQGGYVHLIQEKLNTLPHVKVQTSNYGKAGDRSDQILDRLQSTPAIQQQIKHANVIVMTVGGNDLMQVLEKSFSNISDQELASAVTSSRQTYQKKLKSLLQTVRQYNSKAPIFVYSVYNPFYVYFPTMYQFTKYTNVWNNATKQVVGQTKDAYLINIDQKMSTGQYYHKTKQLKKNSVTDITVLNNKDLTHVLDNQKEKNSYLSPKDHFHPNLKGYRYMTDKLYTAMMKHKTTWLGRRGD